MKDREISRLVLINIGLFFAIVLCAVFFFWLHGTIGAAPGAPQTENAGGTASSSLVRFAPTTRSPEAVPPASSAYSSSPAPSTFKHFTYQSGMTLPVSGKCLAQYFVVLIFPVAVDYREDPLGFNFNTAYPCVTGNVFSETLSLDSLHLPTGSSYYVVTADEKNSGTWYNPR